MYFNNWLCVNGFKMRRGVSIIFEMINWAQYNAFDIKISLFQNKLMLINFYHLPGNNAKHTLFKGFNHFLHGYGYFTRK